MEFDLSMEITAKPRLLSTVRNMVRSYLQEAGFSKERADEIVLGVDEACTNAIRHGCLECEDEVFHLHFSTDDTWIEIHVIDSGPPMPASVKEPKAIEAPGGIEDAQPGGLGMALIHQVCDEVFFDEDALEGNRMTMRLRRPRRG